MPENHWHPCKFESDAVYKSILYLLIIVSEIETVSTIGIKQDIKYLWTVVGSYWEEAKEFYDKRFAELLERLEGLSSALRRMLIPLCFIRTSQAVRYAASL